MGYHITILRTAGREHVPISKDEFLSAARNCPPLRVDVDEGTAEIYSAGQLRATLIWNNGEIWTKAPEPDVIAVMLQVASELQARVRGDGLETYRTPYESYIHPDDKQDADADEAARVAVVSKHKRCELVWSIVRVVVLMVVLLFILKFIRK